MFSKPGQVVRSPDSNPMAKRLLKEKLTKKHSDVSDNELWFTDIQTFMQNQPTHQEKVSVTKVKGLQHYDVFYQKI